MNGRFTVLYVGDPSTDGAVEEALTGEVTVVRVDPGDSLARTTDEPVACAVVGPVADLAGTVRTVLDRFGSPPIVALVDDERSARKALADDVAAVASSDELPELLRARIEHGVDRPRRTRLATSTGQLETSPRRTTARTDASSSRCSTRSTTSSTRSTERGSSTGTTAWRR